MGAANALQAYAAYGRILGDHAMRVLTYMALVSMDGDAEPWFQLGHEALSEFALGRRVPGEDDPAGREAALKSVRRAVTEMQKAGAVRTARRARFGTREAAHTRYRLYLDAPCPQGYQAPKRRAKQVDAAGPAAPDAERPMAADTGRPATDSGTAPPPDAERPVGADGEHPVAGDAPCPAEAVTTGRFVSDHRTESVQAPDAERPPRGGRGGRGANTSKSSRSRRDPGRRAAAAEQDQNFQPSLMFAMQGGAGAGPRPGRWRDPQQIALEQLTEAQRHRAQHGERTESAS